MATAQVSTMEPVIKEEPVGPSPRALGDRAVLFLLERLSLSRGAGRWIRCHRLGAQSRESRACH